MIVLILTAHSYSALFSDEVFFCTIVVFAFVISLILLLAHLLYMISDDTPQLQYFETCFHILGSAVLLISGMFMFAAAVNRPASIESINTERMFASALGMINGLNYGLIGFLTYRKLSASSKQAVVSHGEGLEWEDPLVLSQESQKSGFGSI